MNHSLQTLRLTAQILFASYFAALSLSNSGDYYMRYTLLLFLLALPFSLKAQTLKPPEEAAAADRFKIYRLSQFVSPVISTDSLRVGVPSHPTENEVVLLLDTQTGRTWFLTIQTDFSNDDRFAMVNYIWEEFGFRNLSRSRQK